MNRTELFNRMYELTGDPWTESEEEKRETEKQFYKDLESGDIEIYIKTLEENKGYDCEPFDKKHGVFDFDLMSQYDSIIEELKKYSCPGCPESDEIEQKTEVKTMRKYTIKSSKYACMPSAGFAQEFIKMVSDLDGWYAIAFLKMLDEWTGNLEDKGQDGDFYFYIDCEPSVCFDLDYGFCKTESDMISIQDRNGGINRRWFRWFLLNEETGVEELQFLT